MERPPGTIDRIAPVAVVALAIAGLALLGRGWNETEPAPAEAPAAPKGPLAGLASGPVTVEGRVVDARTAAGLAGAVVIVLRPGVSTREWTQSRPEASEDLIQEATLTAGDGTYAIPDLERGVSYTVMITAEGYEPAVFEQGLEVLPTDPAVTRVAEVRLERP